MSSIMTQHKAIYILTSSEKHGREIIMQVLHKLTGNSTEGILGLLIILGLPKKGLKAHLIPDPCFMQ